MASWHRRRSLFTNLLIIYRSLRVSQKKVSLKMFPCVCRKHFVRLAKNYSTKIQTYWKDANFPKASFSSLRSSGHVNCNRYDPFHTLGDMNAFLSNQPICIRWKVESISEQNLPSYKTFFQNVFPIRRMQS